MPEVDGVAINDLPSGEPLDGTELVPMVRGGTVTLNATTQDIADLGSGGVGSVRVLGPLPYAFDDTLPHELFTPAADDVIYDVWTIVTTAFETDDPSDATAGITSNIGTAAGELLHIGGGYGPGLDASLIGDFATYTTNTTYHSLGGLGSGTFAPTLVINAVAVCVHSLVLYTGNPLAGTLTVGAADFYVVVATPTAP